MISSLLVSSLKYSVGPIPVCRYQYWRENHRVRALKKLSFPHQHSTLLSKTSWIEYTLFKNHLLTYLPDSWQNQLKYWHTLTNFVHTAYTFFYEKFSVFGLKNTPSFKKLSRLQKLSMYQGYCATGISRPLHRGQRVVKATECKNSSPFLQKNVVFLQKFTLTWKMVRTLCGILFSILTPELITY